MRTIEGLSASGLAEVPEPERHEPWNRVEASRKTFQSLEGKAWRSAAYEGIREKPPEGWKNIVLSERLFRYDSQRIETRFVPTVDDVPTDEGRSTLIRNVSEQNRDWEYVGHVGGVRGPLVFARPFFVELESVPIVPGVETSTVRVGESTSNGLRVGTLEVTIDPILSPSTLSKLVSWNSSSLPAHLDEAAIVTIERVSATGTDFEGRNPHVAESGFTGEMQLAFRQMQELGFTTIFSETSDERRARIYQRAGMSPLPEDPRWLVARIDAIGRRTFPGQEREHDE